MREPGRWWLSPSIQGETPEPGLHVWTPGFLLPASPGSASREACSLTIEAMRCAWRPTWTVRCPRRAHQKDRSEQPPLRLCPVGMRDHFSWLASDWGVRHLSRDFGFDCDGHLGVPCHRALRWPSREVCVPEANGSACYAAPCVLRSLERCTRSTHGRRHGSLHHNGKQDARGYPAIRIGSATGSATVSKTVG